MKEPATDVRHPPETRANLRARICAVLHAPFLPAYIVLLAILLTLPSLRGGLSADDYHHKLLMTGSRSVVRILDSPLDMFRFVTDAQRARELIDVGFLPWWADPDLRAAFWRPISSLTHWLDYTLWPQHPALMHAHSILWYALLVGGAALLYRRIDGAGAVAGLGALLYAVDDAHAVPVAFLANRNALLAACLGVYCLLAHDHARGAPRLRAIAGRSLALPLFALSLLAKEEGLATLAYLIAYQVVLDHQPFPKRLIPLLPYLIMVVIWRVAWSGLGYGVTGMSLYVDPLQSPGDFIQAVLARFPVLVLGQMAMPPAELYIGLGGRWPIVLIMAAWGFCLLAAVVLRPILFRDRAARFWGLGMLLALVPMCTTFPSDRMLLFPGLGAMALIARFLVRVFAQTSPPSPAPGRPLVGLGAVLIGLHLMIAPLTLAIHTAFVWGPQWLLDRLYMTRPLEPSVADQDLIVVNPPVAFAMMVTPVQWASEGAPLPAHTRVLTSHLFNPVTITRQDERTLVVEPEAGFLTSPIDRIWRSDRNPLKAGDEIHLTGLDVHIDEVYAPGRPSRVTFRFAVSLDDPSLRWIVWRQGQFVPFTPPRIGETQMLPARWRDLCR